LCANLRLVESVRAGPSWTTLVCPSYRMLLLRAELRTGTLSRVVHPLPTAELGTSQNGDTFLTPSLNDFAQRLLFTWHR